MHFSSLSFLKVLTYINDANKRWEKLRRILLCKYLTISVCLLILHTTKVHIWALPIVNSIILWHLNSLSALYEMIYFIYHIVFKLHAASALLWYSCENKLFALFFCFLFFVIIFSDNHPKRSPTLCRYLNLKILYKNFLNVFLIRYNLIIKGMWEWIKRKFLGHVALDFPKQKLMKTIPILP